MIPALGCGVAGFDLETGARIICEIIHSYEPSSLSDVRFIAYSDEECDRVRGVAESVRGSVDR